MGLNQCSALKQGNPYMEHQGQGIASQGYISGLVSKLGVGHILDLGSVHRGLTLVCG